VKGTEWRGAQGSPVGVFGNLTPLRVTAARAEGSALGEVGRDGGVTPLLPSAMWEGLGRARGPIEGYRR